MPEFRCLVDGASSAASAAAGSVARSVSQSSSASATTPDIVTPDEDSYEARAAARAKAREERERAKKVPTAPVAKTWGKAGSKASPNRGLSVDSAGSSASRSPSVSPRSPHKRQNSGQDQLLQWCAFQTAGMPGVNITDWRSSFADGLAFCALCHSKLPGKIPFDTLSTETKEVRLRRGRVLSLSQSLSLFLALVPAPGYVLLVASIVMLI